jgi:hypothetical protein
MSTSKNVAKELDDEAPRSPAVDSPHPLRVSRSGGSGNSGSRRGGGLGGEIGGGGGGGGGGGDGGGGDGNGGQAPWSAPTATTRSQKQAHTSFLSLLEADDEKRKRDRERERHLQKAELARARAAEEAALAAAAARRTKGWGASQSAPTRQAAPSFSSLMDAEVKVKASQPEEAPSSPGIASAGATPWGRKSEPIGIASSPHWKRSL